MHKHFLFFTCLFFLLGAWHNAQAASVEVTMNSVTKTMSLQDAQGDPIAEDSHTGNTYVFNNLPAGAYTLSGYNSNSEMNGTFTFTVGDNDSELSLQIWTITKISTSNKKEDNSYWVYGEDFTIEGCEVHSREGATFPVTVGVNAGNPSVLTYDGGSVVLRMVPSAEHQAEGYIFAWDGRTVTGNTTIQTKIPLGGTFTSTCPADAEIAVMQKPGGDGGSGTIHFVPFHVIEPESVVTEGNTKTYTWSLGSTCKYNMRAWREGSLTQLLTFYYNTDETKCPVINFTEADFAARDPKWVDHDPQSLDGLNDCNIMLNINEKGYKTMKTGEVYDLMAERVWQIIPNQTENYFLEPDYHYAVYDINGNPDNSVIEIVPDGNIGSEWSIMRAKKKGTAIVTVTYDAASALQYANNTGKMSTYYGGQYFGAIWPENTGVFVVSVDTATHNMDANMRINELLNDGQKKNAGIYVDAEHDVFYYINDEEAFYYTFKPTGVQTVEISYPTHRTNDAVYNTGWHPITKNADNTFTLPLKHGRQIVRLGDGTGNYIYRVLTARHATRNIINETTGGDVFRPGDNVRIQYNGLFHPANKLSGIYNMSAYITYNGTPTGTALILGPNQYWFGARPSAQAVTFTIPKDWTATTYELTEGVIQVTGFGDPIGNHRLVNKVGGRSPNFTAISHQTYFGALPDAIIPVKQLSKTLATLISNPEGAEFTSVTNSLGDEVTAEEGKYLLTEGDNLIIAEKSGYKRTPITVTIPEGCPAEMTITVNLEPVPAEGWNGETQTAVTPTSGIYHITSGAELAWFAAQVNAGTGKSYKAVLDNDIDLCGFNWTPIGNASGKQYAGSFDGKGFTIDNLYLSSTGGCIGLFGYLTQGAEIKNLTVKGAVTSSSTSTTLKAGGVVGTASGSKSKPVKVTNVTNYASVTGHSKYAAGIVGYAGTYVIIDRCANYGNITLSHDTNTKGTDAAGIAYLNATSDTIHNCYNQGTIVANNNVGGIYATSVNASVTNVYNTGRVHATRTNGSGYSCHGAIRPTANTTATTDQVTNAYANEDFLFNELNTIIITNPEAWSGGEVAYKLGDAFGQEIGVDPLPVIGGMTVYEIEMPDGSKYYSNTNESYGEYVRENLTPGQIGTICLPYASFRTFGATFYKMLYKKLDDHGDPMKIYLEEVLQLEPGEPYIFIPEADELRVWYAESTQVLSPADAINGLQGTFEHITDGAAGAPGNKLEGKYIIYNNMFKKCGAYCQLYENRAYIKMAEVPVMGAPNAPQPVPGRRHAVIGNAQAPQVATGAENVVVDTENTAYDVLGRPVDIRNTDIHGVYIVNGQKIVK
ncbi:MAG: hypothetical protein IKO63_07730 [Paludibacteraceae bacterium]|nr:hypothetical protein [Paludibacteraceae bacterium]